MNSLTTINRLRWRAVNSVWSFGLFLLNLFLFPLHVVHPFVHNHTTTRSPHTRIQDLWTTLSPHSYPYPFTPSKWRVKVRLQWLTYSITHLKCSARNTPCVTSGSFWVDILMQSLCMDKVANNESYQERLDETNLRPQDLRPPVFIMVHKVNLIGLRWSSNSAFGLHSCTATIWNSNYMHSQVSCTSPSHVWNILPKMYQCRLQASSENVGMT